MLTSKPDRPTNVPFKLSNALEGHVFGVIVKVTLDGNFQALMHRVEELPESYDAGELDYLFGVQMLFESLTDLIGYV